MATTVLDSTDLTGILADAGVELEQSEPVKLENEPESKERKAEPKEDPDDVEGEDGLTPRQKRELTSQMQKAIGKKHRMLREAEEFAANEYSQRRLAEERAAKLQQEIEDFRSKLNPKIEAPKPPEKPDRSQFATDGEYLDAMIQYGVDERLRKKAEDDARASAERQREERIASIREKVARAAEIVPDWDEVVSETDVSVPPVIAGYMEKSELIAELSYHFAKNPEILESLAKLPPDEQLVKIGKIESTLSPFGSEKIQDDAKSSQTSNGKASAAPSKQTEDIPSKPRSNTAPVITPLDGTGVAGSRIDPKDMNIREAIEDYSKRNRLNLGARKRH